MNMTKEITFPERWFLSYLFIRVSMCGRGVWCTCVVYSGGVRVWCMYAGLYEHT